MALVRPTDQWTAKPRSPQLNSTPQHHRPRTRTTGDTAPKTTHARHRKPTTQQNQPPINSTHERSRLGIKPSHWKSLTCVQDDPSQVIAYSPCHDGESAAPAGGATARSRATGRPNRRDRTIGRPPGECRRSSGTGCRENLIACRAVAVKSGHPFAKCIARRPLATTPASKSTTHGRRWLFGPQSIRLRQ